MGDVEQMSMHMEGPWLSTTGKKKGPKKWASAEQKRKAEQLQQQWEDLKKRNGIKDSPKIRAKETQGILRISARVPPGRETPKIESRDTGWVACVKPSDQTYTGTKVKGIGTMHKSNAVPIFSDEEAVDISKMRR